jgi:hypothetical protein
MPLTGVTIRSRISKSLPRGIASAAQCLPQRFPYIPAHDAQGRTGTAQTLDLAMANLTYTAASKIQGAHFLFRQFSVY